MYLRFIPESPRWLLSVGKYRKANNVLAKIARFNGKEADSVQLSSNHKYDGTDGKENGGEVENSSKSDDVSIATATKEKSATILDLFKSRLILKITVVMMFVW